MDLVIVESPGKVKKISSILGNSYRVAASVGHIRDLPIREMGIEPPNFRPRYDPTERGRSVITRLKKEVSGASQVLLATDPDREGEAIAWHLAEVLRLKNPKRITFTAITPEQVKAALANPRQIDIQLVRAQEARRVLDRIIGYRVSPVLQTTIQQRVSAGRVQTPAVRLVVDREREIRDFRSVEHYGAELAFETDSSVWKAQWEAKPYLSEGQEYLSDKALAQRASEVRRVEVLEFSDTQKTRPPAPPFTTSTLQQSASSRLKFKPKKTMDIAQKLYEQGAITYHRTDNPNTDPAGIEDIIAYAQKAGLPTADKPRRWKAKEDAQAGHEAIRPTHAFDLDAGETQDEKKLYRLIWQRAVASQLAAAVYAVRTVRLGAGGFGYTATGRTLVSPGWMRIYESNEEEEANNPVPTLKEGAELEVSDGRLLIKYTQPPTRYTEATLVKELEKQGIGRPSTYASIMEHIVEKGYVQPDKKEYLVPTPLGEAIRDALVGRFCFVDLEYTRQMEESLDKIATGKAEYHKVVSDTWQTLDRELGELTKLTKSEVSAMPEFATYPCPECGKPMRRIEGQYGFFWGCSGYPECKAKASDVDGRPGEKKQAAVLHPEHPCPECGKPMRRIDGRLGAFWGCSGYPECRATLPDEDGKPGKKKPYPAGRSSRSRASVG